MTRCGPNSAQHSKESLLAIWKETAETRGLCAQPGEHRAALAALCGTCDCWLPAMPTGAVDLSQNELATASNMTAEIGASNAPCSALMCRSANLALDKFYTRHAGDHLLVDKWFALNSYVPGAGAAARIERLMAHPDFRLEHAKPRLCAHRRVHVGKSSGFNAADGEGYRVVADTILKLDRINPQVAARMATGFRSWRIMDEVRRRAAAAQLERLVATPGLSRDAFEIISRTLKS